MDAYSEDNPSLSPCSTFHEPGPACSIYSTLDEFPFLYTIINKDSRRKVSRCAAFLFWVLYLVSRILLPYFLRRPLFAVIVWLDNLWFLAACYFEHAFPQTSYYLWDRAVRTPYTLRQRLMIQPARRLSETAGTCLRRVSESRLGPIVVKISTHADEDIAEVLRIAADTCEELVNHFLPHTDVIIQAGPHNSEPTQLSPENGVLQLAAFSNRAAGGYSANVEEVNLVDFETTETTETRSREAEASTMDHLYVGEPQGDVRASVEDAVIERRFHLSEDEGYASGKDVAIPTVVAPEESPPKIVQAPGVKSLLEPFETVGKADTRHGSINPYAQPAPLMLITPRPTIRTQRSMSGNDAVFPSKATFDDILGLRRRSQTGAEAKRLVSISVDAASRAHHHWLRPCAACAKKAAEEKPKKRLGKLIAEEMQGSEETKAADGVYKRTVHWVRRQEERIKQL